MTSYPSTRDLGPDPMTDFRLWLETVARCLRQALPIAQLQRLISDQPVAAIAASVTLVGDPPRSILPATTKMPVPGRCEYALVRHHRR